MVISFHSRDSLHVYMCRRLPICHWYSVIHQGDHDYNGATIGIGVVVMVVYDNEEDWIGTRVEGRNNSSCEVIIKFFPVIFSQTNPRVPGALIQQSAIQNRTSICPYIILLFGCFNTPFHQQTLTTDWQTNVRGRERIGLLRGVKLYVVCLTRSIPLLVDCAHYPTRDVKVRLSGEIPFARLCSARFTAHRQHHRSCCTVRCC